MDRVAKLAAAFDPASRDAWLKLADKAFGGPPPPGLLYEPGQVEPVVAARGPHEAMRPWDIRAIVDHPDPRQANAQAIEDLQGGAASLLVRTAGPGRRGVGVAGAQDLETVLDGVMAELAPVALDAGFDGPAAAQALAAAARRSPRARLAFHLDPLGAFAQEGRSPGPIAAHVARAAQVGASFADALPSASLFLANGRAIHEAGGSDAQELAGMAAAAIAYVRALGEGGLPADQALGRVTLGVSLDGRFLQSIAKLRAARLVWAQLAKAWGIELPAVVEARASRRMLSPMDVWANLLRLTAAAFAGAVGGADALVLEPFTEPLGPPNGLARRQARNIQLVLMEEAFLGRVEDPARGAGWIDAASLKLAGEAWAALQAIEGAGGLAAALASGAVAREVEAHRDRVQALFATGEAKLVGVNLYPDPGGQAPEAGEASPPAAAGFGESALAGADDTCPPLVAHRWSEPFEDHIP